MQAAPSTQHAWLHGMTASVNERGMLRESVLLASLCCRFPSMNKLELLLYMLSEVVRFGCRTLNNILNLSHHVMHPIRDHRSLQLRCSATFF